MPDEVVAALASGQRLDGRQIARFKRIGSTLPDSGAETIRAEGTHVADHGEAELSPLARAACGSEGVGYIAAVGLIEVCGIGLKAGEGDMVVVRGRAGISG